MGQQRSAFERDSFRRSGGGGVDLATAADTPTQIDLGDAAAVGTSPRAAHADHQHAFPAPGTPTQIDVGDTGSAGVSTKAAAEDHQHPFPDPFLSPMKNVSGGTIRFDNANTKTLPGGFVSNDLDTDVNNGFVVPKLTGALVMPVPKAPTSTREGRKVTLQITSRGTAADTITWTGGAGGWKWPDTSGIGPLQADFDAALAAMANNAVILVGAQYHTVLDRWLINSVAGPYT